MTSEVALNKLKVEKSEVHVVEVRGHLGTFESRQGTRQERQELSAESRIFNSQKRSDIVTGVGVGCWGFPPRVETALLWVWMKETSGSYTSGDDSRASPSR